MLFCPRIALAGRFGKELLVVDIELSIEDLQAIEFTEQHGGALRYVTERRIRLLTYSVKLRSASAKLSAYISRNPDSSKGWEAAARAEPSQTTKARIAMTTPRYMGC